MKIPAQPTDLKPGQTAPSRRPLKGVLSQQEIADLTQRSDLHGLWAIVSTWAIVAIAFTMAAVWPNPLTIVAALMVIAGRQLAFGILQHEGAHGTLFKTRWMNEVVVDWLCARPVWQHVGKYRTHHLIHHARTGTPDDPDISLHAGFPVTTASLRRKMLRDIAGVTGLKLLFGLALMDAGVIKWTVANDIEKLPQAGRRWWNYPIDFFRNSAGMWIANGTLLGILAATGHAWLYSLWVVAYITPFPLFMRIRSIAEHGALERDADVFKNTRTTQATVLERLLWAPVRVNFHIEHHLLASVPYYRLPRLHAVLRERQLVAEPPSYREVYSLVTTRAAA